MPTPEWLAEQFEEHRAHLRAVAYRMLGSASEAEDAVQDGWIRLGRTDVSTVENLRAWLTTVVARVCLDMLRTRTSRREAPLDEHDVHVPDPVITRADDPESNAVLADSVGLALLVVLEALEPAERLAFVLHDVFGMTFDEIAPIVDRSPVAARQLASRARRRVQGSVLTQTATCSSSGVSSMRSSRPLARAISNGSSPCSIRTSCCERMAVRSQAHHGLCEGPRPWPNRPRRSRGSACPIRWSS
jgi:RNA polymerase sigma factor (sigma-70 family)